MKIRHLVMLAAVTVVACQSEAPVATSEFQEGNIDDPGSELRREMQQQQKMAEDQKLIHRSMEGIRGNITAGKR